MRIAGELKPTASRWPPALALLVALLIVSLLLLIRVPETEITLEAAVTDISFTLPAEKPVIGRSGVARLGVSGLSDLKISPDVLADLAGTQHDNRAKTFRLTVSSNTLSAGSINTAALIPPSGTKVWLSHTGVPRSYRLSLKPPKKGRVTLNADVRGELEVAAPGFLDGVKNCDFGKSGATLEFGSDNDILDVDFVLNENSDLQFYTQVPIENLSFSRIEEFATPDKSLINPISTILSGTLYLESLNGEKRELRPGEPIRLNGLTGRIETLKLEGNRISFKIRGRVSGVKVGDEGVGRNLMPNLLQWLAARQPLSLLWGATIFVYGVIGSIVHWYRR